MGPRKSRTETAGLSGVAGDSPARGSLRRGNLPAPRNPFPLFYMRLLYVYSSTYTIESTVFHVEHISILQTGWRPLNLFMRLIAGVVAAKKFLHSGCVAERLRAVAVGGGECSAHVSIGQAFREIRSAQKLVEEPGVEAVACANRIDDRYGHGGRGENSARWTRRPTVWRNWRRSSRIICFSRSVRSRSVWGVSSMRTGDCGQRGILISRFSLVEVRV